MVRCKQRIQTNERNWKRHVWNSSQSPKQSLQGVRRYKTYRTVIFKFRIDTVRLQGDQAPKKTVLNVRQHLHNQSHRHHFAKHSQKTQGGDPRNFFRADHR